MFFKNETKDNLSISISKNANKCCIYKRVFYKI